MGFILNHTDVNTLLAHLQQNHRIFAPKRFTNGGAFSDTDCVRYGEISTIDEVEFNAKSNYSFKETVLPIMQTLFYFTEGTVTEPEVSQKGLVVFLRSCDLHGLKRLDTMYLKNGPADYYYAQRREKVKFVLMGCAQSFENCFCVSMGSNQSDNYHLSMDPVENGFALDCKDEGLAEILTELGGQIQDVTPKFVAENDIKVTINENLDANINTSPLWEEYNTRCIACGRCNFVCPTCSCFTMQDMYYSENGKVGERRKVWASCMVDGFTDVAGGGKYRTKNGERMRFKVLHKVSDYKKRHGEHMCVGCGRCDDVCPEYISFSNCINKLSQKEVTQA